MLTGEHARVVDLRTVGSGESCPNCGAPLESFNALEVGHIFKLGTRYSERMGAYVLTADGSSVPLVMGSYGIGLERLLAAVVEAHHDDDGIIWPAALSPYDVEVVAVGGEPELAALADNAIAHLLAAGLDVLYDRTTWLPGPTVRSTTPTRRASIVSEGPAPTYCQRSKRQGERIAPDVAPPHLPPARARAGRGPY